MAEETDVQQQKMAPTSRRPQTWFIVAHCFNMDGRAASQTITDRLPLLMAGGVTPVVLSAPTGSKDRRFPHYRVLSPAPSGFLFELRHLIGRHLRSRAGQLLLKALLTIACLPFYLLEKIFIHLDSQWSWFLGAAVEALFIVRRHRPDIIYTTAGPPTTHVVGFLIHRLCGLPWLAEVHDPLVYDDEPRGRQRYRFRNLIEGLISRHADAVIYFTDQALAHAQRRHPFRGRTHVLRPGAAAPALTGPAYAPGREFHLGHFGSLAEERNLAGIFNALHGLLQATPRWQETLRVDVYGAQLDPVSRRTLAALPLPGTVVEHGRLEFDPRTGKSGRQQVAEAMRCCDVLLLVHGEGTVCDQYIPSKLYEYLHAHRPILGIAAPGSELEQILRACGHPVVPPNDDAGLRQALADLVGRWETIGLPDTAAASPFTIDAAVERLRQIAAAIADDGQAPTR